MSTYRRRFYTGVGEFWKDFRYILRRRPAIKRAMSGGQLSEAFRERLMLVVTEVNDCRYCRRFHAAQALQSGVSTDQVQQMMAGQLPTDVPDEEVQALAYAQHWAEENAHPDSSIVSRTRKHYGEETFQSIEIILRMIRMGNLLGNTWDFILHRLTFGRLGGEPQDGYNQAGDR